MQCKDCAHFVRWPGVTVWSYSSNPEGVCTAPRPKIGPAPNREVNGHSGKECPTFKALSGQKGDDND